MGADGRASSGRWYPCTTMIRYVTRLGDQFALIIDPSILELLGIDESTPLDVRTDGKGFQIVPVAPSATAAVPRTTSAAVKLTSASSSASPPTMTSAPSPPTTPAPLVPAPLPAPALPASATTTSAPLAAAPPVPAPPVAAPLAPAPPVPVPLAPAPLPLPSPAHARATPTHASTEGLAEAYADPPSQTMEVHHPDDDEGVDAAPPPRVVVLRDGAVVFEVPFTVDELLIGRNKQAQVPLDDRALSRDHAKLSRRGASFWIADLGSANGTYVGAERITEPRLLRAGDVIVVGQYTLRIDGVEEAPTDTPVLTISGPGRQHRFAMVGADIVIGRADDCDVAINNRSISRRHLQIARGTRPGTFVATNISGHNVVKVDGVPISEPTPFHLGTPLEIGDFTITIGEAQDSTMVFDRTALAKAAYVDGDYGDASAGASASAGGGTGQHR